MDFIDRRIQQAQHLCNQGQFLDARKLLEDICEEIPRNVNAWHLLGGVNGFLGEYEKAAECASKVIRMAPGIPEGHSNLGVALLKMGQLAQAQRSFLKALSLRPGHAKDHCNLGVSLCAQASYELAATSLEKAVALDTGFADAYHNLGRVYHELNLPDKALENFEHAVQLEPGIAKYHVSLGYALIRSGNYDRAMLSANQALTLESNNVDAMRIKGAIYADTNQHQKAIAEYEQAVALQPERADLHLALGRAHLFYARRWSNPWFGDAYKAALSSFREAERIDPDSIDVLYNLARCLEDTGELAQALMRYQELAARAPDHVEAVCGQARVHEKTGDFARSLELLTGLLKQGWISNQVLEAYASLCRLFGHCDDAVDRIEAFLANNKITPDQECRLRFQLGQLYDRSKHYDIAFEQYQTANRLKHVTYDIAADEAYADNLLRIFSVDRYHKIPFIHGESNIVPIFIVGMPRSGSSLVEQILASHPDVFGGDELPYIEDVLGKIELNGTMRTWPEYVPDLDRETCKVLAGKYLAKLRELAPGYRYVTDKMPHNFLYIGLIHKLFPDAPLIYTERNPADTCLSCYFQNFLYSHAYACDLHDVGMHYRLHRKIMRHFLDALGLPLFLAQYEEIVKDLEGSLSILLKHCGLDWNDECLRFYESGRLSRTASYDQVRQPVYTHSIGRWRHYEKHIGVLLDTLKSPAQ